ncbi:MAG: acyl-CoA thioesterase [Alphaproteobacteria bacterium]|nr:acyl-CoA thioesterase [Alphaproteobacteria bacterium]
MPMRATRTYVVNWGDCDPADIVYYPNFYRWFDDATWAMLAAHGITRAVFDAKYKVPGAPLVETQARYLVPCRQGDVLTIESRVAKVERKTFVVEHRILNGGKTAVEGHEVRVWAGRHPDDPTRLKAWEIPAEVRALLEG